MGLSEIAGMPKYQHYDRYFGFVFVSLGQPIKTGKPFETL